MGFPSHDPAAAVALKALLAEVQDLYARLLVALEQYLAVDHETAPDLAEARDHQSSLLMREADARLQVLRQTIEPWSQRRRGYPPELAAHVDQFLELLQKSLLGIEAQIRHRTGDLQRRKDALQAAMGQLGNQRRGLMGYNSQRSSESRFLDKNV